MGTISIKLSELTQGETVDLRDIQLEDLQKRVGILEEQIKTFKAEPKHGRWIESWDGKWHNCSVCGGIPPFNFKGEDLLTDFCPNCGARMYEVEE